MGKKPDRYPRQGRRDPKNGEILKHAEIGPSDDRVSRDAYQHVQIRRLTLPQTQLAEGINPRHAVLRDPLIRAIAGAL